MCQCTEEQLTKKSGKSVRYKTIFCRLAAHSRSLARTEKISARTPDVPPPKKKKEKEFFEVPKFAPPKFLLVDGFFTI